MKIDQLRQGLDQDQAFYTRPPTCVLVWPWALSRCRSFNLIGQTKSIATNAELLQLSLPRHRITAHKTLAAMFYINSSK